MKSEYKLSKMGWFGVVRAIQGRYSIEHIYVPILHCFWDIARHWSKIADCNLPTCIWRPRWWVTPIGISPRSFGLRKLQSLGYRIIRMAFFACMVLRLAVWYNYWPACDGRTDTQRQQIPREQTSIASRGN